MAGSVAQAFEHVDTASGTTSVVAATFTGNGIVACATNDASAASTISAADPTNGAYSVLDLILDTTDQQQFAHFGKANSTASGAVNVTFTWTAANVFKAGCVVDCTGVAGALDQHTGAYQHAPTTTANTQLSGTTAALNAAAASGALVVGLGFASGGNAPPAQGTTGGTWNPPVTGSATFWSFGGGLTLRIEWQRVTSTTGVQAVFTSAANIDAITTVAVIDETAGAAAQVPPPRLQSPRWPDPTVPAQPPGDFAPVLATPPVVNAPLPFRRSIPDWTPTQAPTQIRIGVAAILAVATAASAPPAPARPMPAWPDAPAAAQPSRYLGPLTPAVIPPLPQPLRARSAWPDPSVPIAIEPELAAVLAPTPPQDAPLPNDLARRRLPSRWPEAEWSVRQPLPKLTNGPFSSRYPISISGRKMFDAQGLPFRIKGRTAWAIMGLTPTLRDAFLDDCVAHGFNTIECQIPTRAPEMNLRPDDSAGNHPFLKTLGGATWNGSLSWSGNSNAPDFNTPNPSYWASVDALMQACYNRQIMVMPFFAYLGQGGGSTAEGWLDEFNAIEAVSGTAGLQSYGAFVGDRFKAFPNIIYGTAGDTASGFDAEFYTTTGIQSVSGQASGPQFTSQRAGGQISTDGSGALGTSTTINGAYDWATIITQCQRAYSASASIPGFMIEEPYEDEGTAGTGDNPTFSNTPPAMRRYEWWGWLNSIGGYVAGNGYIWRFELSGTPPLHDDYRNHLNTRNTQDLTQLNAFMELWPNTNDLIPGGLGGMRALVVSGAGTIDTDQFVCAAQTSDGTLLIGYTPPSASGTFSVDLRSMAGRPLKAYWVDPTDNSIHTSATAANTFTLANTASAQSFTIPTGTNSVGDTDWALVVEAQAASSVQPSPPRSPALWGLDTAPVQRRSTVAAILATPPTISSPPLRGTQQLAQALWVPADVPVHQVGAEIAPLVPSPAVTQVPPPPVQLAQALWWAIDPSAVPVHQEYSEVAAIIPAPAGNVPPPRAPAPFFPDPWSPPPRAATIAAVVQDFPRPSTTRQTQSSWVDAPISPAARPGIATVVQDFPPLLAARQLAPRLDPQLLAQPRSLVAVLPPAPDAPLPIARAPISAWADPAPSAPPRLGAAALISPPAAPSSPQPPRVQAPGWPADPVVVQPRPGAAALLPALAPPDNPPPLRRALSIAIVDAPPQQPDLAQIAPQLAIAPAAPPPPRLPAPSSADPVAAQQIRLGIGAVTAPAAPPPSRAQTPVWNDPIGTQQIRLGIAALPPVSDAPLPLVRASARVWDPIAGQQARPQLAAIVAAPAPDAPPPRLQVTPRSAAVDDRPRAPMAARAALIPPRAAPDAPPPLAFRQPSWGAWEAAFWTVRLAAASTTTLVVVLPPVVRARLGAGPTTATPAFRGPTRGEAE